MFFKITSLGLLYYLEETSLLNFLHIVVIDEITTKNRVNFAIFKALTYFKSNFNVEDLKFN